ncbi:MAG: hypothetical protein P1V97_29680 [Planctomycetota bacterium]|nr:hypothetical protein [Planctomycetota bacterium]
MSGKKTLAIVGGIISLTVAVGIGYVTVFQLKRDPNQIKVGAAAPKVSFLNLEGKKVELAPILKTKAAILVFYRGAF